MPYVPEEIKKELWNRNPAVAGELTYLLTKVINDYVKEQGLCFNVAGEAILALECTKLEFYRRILAPYEDTAKERNGDVYDI